MSKPGTDPKGDSPADHLVDAYEKMLEQTRNGIDQAQDATPMLRRFIDRARDQMVEFGELTREEAEKISGYVERDIADAATYIAETGEDLKSWWRFDLDLIEKRLLDTFTSVADQTNLQLSQLAEQARRASLYQAGQITGPGTLICDNCEAETHFTRTGRIPACTDCGGLVFRRTPAEQQQGDDA